MKEVYTTWSRRWKAALAACDRLGGDARELVISPPASDAVIRALEVELGVGVPPSFRNVLAEFSSSVDMTWYLPDDASLPQGLRGIFSGGCSWSMKAVAGAEQSRRLWVEMCFTDDSDDYNAVWHNKLGFSEVANGDVIAFDLNISLDPPIVYLSHDDGPGHGYRLGNNFVDFMERWSLLGCPGNEDWQMTPFLKDATSGLDPYGENARLWRDWFGLNIEV